MTNKEARAEIDRLRREIEQLRRDVGLARQVRALEDRIAHGGADEIERLHGSLLAVERMLDAGNPLSALEFVRSVLKQPER